MDCHGGRALGDIHGTNDTYQVGETTSASRYRFMSGAVMRFYSPSGTTTVSDADWEDTSVVGCYTLTSVQVAADDYASGCSSHGGGFTTVDSRRARPLTY